MAVGLMLVFPVARLASARGRPAGTEEIQSVAEARARLEQAQRAHLKWQPLRFRSDSMPRAEG